MKSVIQILKKNWIFIVLLLFVSIPLFSGHLYRISGGHDINFHLMRIEGIAEGLRMGQFPVKIQPAWYQGYGYGCSVFYGDIFLYIPALLRLAGLSLQKAYKIYIFLVQTATVAAAYYSFGKIFKDRYVGMVGAALYSLSVYRLMNIFVRGAMGEYTAMIFLPLIAYSMVLLLQAESTKKELQHGSLLLALSMTGILQSHILSVEIACIMLALICLIYIKRVLKGQVFFAFLKAVLLAVALNIGFLVPFADYMVTGKFNVNAINGGWRVEQNIQDLGAFVSQLLQAFYQAEGGNLPREMGTQGEMPIGVGFSLVFALVMLVILGFKLSKEDKQHQVWRLAKISGLIAVVSLFMSTCYFPWEALRKSNVLIRYLVINLQFPWRFCTISSVALVMLWCCLMKLALRKWQAKRVLASAGVVVFVSAVTAGSLLIDVLREGQAFVAVFADKEATMVESGEEYLPVNTISDDFAEENLYIGEGIVIEKLSRNGIRLKIACANHSGHKQVMEVPLLYYKGYEAVAESAQGDEQKLIVASGNNQVVSVTVPADFSGMITVDFKEPWYWRMAEGITLLTVLIIGAMRILYEGRYRRKKEA